MSRKFLFYALAFLFMLSPLWLSAAFPSLLPHAPELAQNTLLFSVTFALAIIISSVLSTRFYELAFNSIKAIILRYEVVLTAIIYLLGFGLIVWTNHYVIYQFFNSADEFSCHFLAHCLLRGRLWVDSPLLSDFFLTPHVGIKEGKWFSVYPLGWPLIWSLGIRANLSHYVNPIVSLSAVFLLSRLVRKYWGSLIAIAGSLICLSSPFYVFTSAAYYSHPVSLLCLVLFLTFFDSWIKPSKNQALTALLCGISLGYALMTRYLTAAACFLVLAIELIELSKSKRNHISVASGLLFTVSLCAFIGINLYHNWSVTGTALLAPNTYDKPWEKLGFKDTYTPLDGFFFIMSRFFYLSDWIAPVYLIAYAVSLCDWRSESSVMRMGMIIFPALVSVYYFYFSWGGGQYGPRYYWEAIPFISFGAAFGIRKLFICTKTFDKKLFSLLLIGGLFIHGIYFMNHSRYYGSVSLERSLAFKDILQSTEKPSLIYLAGDFGKKMPLSAEDAIRNLPDYEHSDTIFVRDLGQELNVKLIEEFPDHHLYRAFYDKTKGRSVVEVLPRGNSKP